MDELSAAERLVLGLPAPGKPADDEPVAVVVVDPNTAPPPPQEGAGGGGGGSTGEGVQPAAAVVPGPPARLYHPRRLEVTAAADGEIEEVEQFFWELNGAESHMLQRCTHHEAAHAAAHCVLRAVRYVLRAACCVLRAACCVLRTADCGLNGACSLPVPLGCSLPQAACCMLHAACCMLTTCSDCRRRRPRRHRPRPRPHRPHRRPRRPRCRRRRRRRCRGGRLLGAARGDDAGVGGGGQRVGRRLARFGRDPAQP